MNVEQVYSAVLTHDSAQQSPPSQSHRAVLNKLLVDSSQ